MNVFYAIVRILTVPGAVFRFLLEQMTCRSAKIPVFSKSFWRPDDTCSHVEHEDPTDPRLAYDVCASAFAVNFIMGSVVSAAGLGLFFVLGVRTWWALLILWLGFSLLCNLFPTKADVVNLKYRLSQSEKKYPFKRMMSGLYSFGSAVERTSLILLTSALWEVVLWLCMLLFGAAIG